MELVNAKFLAPAVCLGFDEQPPHLAGAARNFCGFLGPYRAVPPTVLTMNKDD
jgi:hypothetical protein